MSTRNNSTLFPSLDTPAILVDLDKLDRNIQGLQQIANKGGVKLRPHTKCHECAYIARLQMQAGACGMSVGTLGTAEAMADAGIEDIMIVHPFYGDTKLEKLKKLLNGPRLKISVVVDMLIQAIGISQVGQAVGKQVPVLIKIDAGIRRFGCPPGEPALKLAKELRQLPGVRLSGILTFETPKNARSVEDMKNLTIATATTLAETARMLRKEGIPIEDVVSGATVGVRNICRYREELFPEITEVHPGSYVLGDMHYVDNSSMTKDECAATVLTTVVSTPSPERAVLDAGAKTFGNDPLLNLIWKPDYFRDGRPSYGSIVGRPDIWVGRITYEACTVYFTDPNKKLNVGERLEIIPNSTTLTFNQHDEVYGVRKGEIERVIRVTGRGEGN